MTFPPFLIGERDGSPYSLSLAALHRSFLCVGASGCGKTAFTAMSLFPHLYPNHPDASVVVLDAAHTLVRTLVAEQISILEDGEADLKESGDWDAEDEQTFQEQRDRLVVVPFDATNSHGIGINLTELSPGETPKERVDILTGLLDYQREGTIDFNVVASVARAVFSVLVHAERPVTDLQLLLADSAHGNDALAATLQQEITAHGHLAHDHDGDMRRSIDTYFALCARPFRDFTDQVRSTRGMYQWMTQDCASYFQQTKLGQFTSIPDLLERRGILLVDFQHPNSRTVALARRAFTGLVQNHGLARTGDAHPILLVEDEIAGLDPDLLAEHVVRGRNTQLFHWLLVQSISQFGTARDALLAAMHRVVAFRPMTMEDATELAHLTAMGAPDALRLDTIAETESEGWGTTESENDTDSLRSSLKIAEDGLLLPSGSDTGEGHARGRSRAASGSKGITKSKERVGLSEQVLVHARSLLRLPIGTAIHRIDQAAFPVVHTKPQFSLDTPWGKADLETWMRNRRVTRPPVSPLYCRPLKEDKKKPSVDAPPPDAAPILKENGKPPGRHRR